ncbi:MAG: ATPase, T2SS/T4P/T4SS family [Planctomycetaceae bacterium]|nr:ATPase, T2SS/T4P/T4SS family [Planctomycetaceae bacterium]
MIFGMFGKKSDNSAGDDDEDEEVELCTFQGALNGKDVDLAANARLAQAGLVPSKELVTDAIVRRAEQAKIELKGERAQVTLYVDGIAYSGGKLAKPQFVAVTQMLKVLAGLDPKLKGQVQSGGVKADYLGTPYEVELEATPQPTGADKVVLKPRNLKAKFTTMEELGFSPSLKALLRETAQKKKGLIIVAGPSASGVTTTVYAFLKGLDLYTHSAFTIVKMGTREVYNVQKFEANEADDYGATMLRMLRAEADVIFVDPINGPELAKQTAEVADRTVILAEMPAKDAASGIVQFRDWIGDKAKMAEVLGAFFGVKLIRMLCADCKEAFKPNPKLLQKVGLPPETKVLYRKPEPEPDPKTGEMPDPCEKCGGIGYFGRVPMVECILASETIGKLIAEGATADQIKAQARAEGMQTLHKDGLRLVAEGKTSLEELQRIFKA